MLSAFGVEHGEISKAKFPSLKTIGTKTGKLTERSGIRMMQSGQSGWNRAGMRRPGVGAQARRGLSNAGFSTAETGRAMAARPEATGIAMTALGAGGAGATAGSFYDRSKRRR